MSEDLFSEFPPVTAAQWLEQIARDLKGGAPEKLQWSPDGEVFFSPFVHAEDAPSPLPQLPGFGNWMISESFDVSDPQTARGEILEALKGGVESILLSGPAGMAWSELLEDVALPLIHLGFNFQDDAVRGLSGFAAYAGAEAVFRDLRISVYGKAFDTYPNVRFCAASVYTGHIVPDLTNTFLNALAGANWDRQLLSLQDISLEVHGHYLIEIARIRACRLLWENLADALQFQLSPSFAIEVRTAHPAGGDDPNNHMIRSAFMGTAAVLGGADRVAIAPAHGTPESAAFYRHVARNVSHLLRYESKFTEIPDPVAGAYYMDHVVTEIVNKTWENLKTEIKNSGR